MVFRSIESRFLEEKWRIVINKSFRSFICKLFKKKEKFVQFPNL